MTEEPGDQLLFDSNLVLLSGYGKLPDVVSGRATHHVVGIIVVARRSTGEIVRLDAAALSRLATEFLRAQLLGLSVRDDVDQMNARILASYHGMARGAVMESIRKIVEKFAKLEEVVPD